jgi:RNA polymerase sigma factor (sigma-70 family)
MDNLYIQKVLNGDCNAFSYFVNEYKDMAFAVAFRIVNNREDTEEIVQDSFLKAFRSLGKFRQDSKFSTWFYRIVINQSLTKVQRRKTRPDNIDLKKAESIAVDEIESGYSRLSHSDQRKHINDALNDLNMEDSLILTLYYLNENSLEEIAEMTGIKWENLKMKVHRARQKLFYLLEQKLKSEIKDLL